MMAPRIDERANQEKEVDALRRLTRPKCQAARVRSLFEVRVSIGIRACFFAVASGASRNHEIASCSRYSVVRTGAIYEGDADRPQVICLSRAPAEISLRPLRTRMVGAMSFFSFDPRY